MDRRSRGGRPRRPSRPPPPRRPRPKNRPRRRPPPVAVKLIVRRLPPTLTADAFAEVADAHGAKHAVWRSYMPGSIENTGSIKRTAHVVRHSVAYLAFDKIDHAVAFHDAFNAFRFVDAAKTVSGSLHTGSEYYARVERAMNQTVPPLHRRSPPAAASTIESDPDFMAFLEALEGEQRERPISLGQTSAMFPTPSEDKRRAKDVITPLMEDVRARRKERDDKHRGKIAHKSGKKSRQVVEHRQPESAGKSSSRKKKRRGGESANVPQQETTQATEQNSLGRAEKRNNTNMQRGEEGKSASGQASMKSPSSRGRASAAELNGSTPEVKPSPRGASSRSRAGRGARGKGKQNSSQSGVVSSATGRAVPQGQNSLHGRSGMLKKEASTTSAT